MRAQPLSSVLLLATLWTVAHQGPLEFSSEFLMEFSNQEYWSELSFPTPWDLPNPRIEPVSLVSPAFAKRIKYWNMNCWVGLSLPTITFLREED